MTKKETKTPTPVVEPAEKEVLSNITKRLEGEEVTKTVDETAPKAVENNKIDLTTLTPDQIATLKQMFQSAPDVVAKPKGNTLINLREIDGKIIIDFKKSYMTLKTDTVARKDIEVPMIPVKFMDETDFKDIELYTFHNANRVSCEVVGHKSEKEEIFEGKTINRNTGEEVSMNKYIVTEYYDVKLPDGKVVTITNDISNG